MKKFDIRSWASELKALYQRGHAHQAFLEEHVGEPWGRARLDAWARSIRERLESSPPK